MQKWPILVACFCLVMWSIFYMQMPWGPHQNQTQDGIMLFNYQSCELKNNQKKPLFLERTHTHSLFYSNIIDLDGWYQIDTFLIVWCTDCSAFLVAEITDLNHHTWRLLRIFNSKTDLFYGSRTNASRTNYIRMNKNKWNFILVCFLKYSSIILLFYMYD
jgi:hypothetical protein